MMITDRPYEFADYILGGIRSRLSGGDFEYDGHLVRAAGFSLLKLSDDSLSVRIPPFYDAELAGLLFALCARLNYDVLASNEKGHFLLGGGKMPPVLIDQFTVATMTSAGLALSRDTAAPFGSVSMTLDEAGALLSNLSQAYLKSLLPQMRIFMIRPGDGYRVHAQEMLRAMAC